MRKNKLEKGEIEELSFTGFVWARGGKLLINGSWTRFTFTDRRMILQDAIFPFLKVSIPWEDIKYVNMEKRGKKKVLVLGLLYPFAKNKIPVTLRISLNKLETPKLGRLFLVLEKYTGKKLENLK